MSLFAPPGLPRFPVSDPLFQSDRELNREERRGGSKGFNSLSGYSELSRRGNGEIYSLFGMPAVVTSRRAHLRYMATSRPAISLDRVTRQAAAADPGLEWDADAYRYRLRRIGVRGP